MRLKKVLYSTEIKNSNCIVVTGQTSIFGKKHTYSKELQRHHRKGIDCWFISDTDHSEYTTKSNCINLAETVIYNTLEDTAKDLCYKHDFIRSHH